MQDPAMMAQMQQMQQEGMMQPDQQQYYDGMQIQPNNPEQYQYAMPDDQQIGPDGQMYDHGQY